MIAELFRGVPIVDERGSPTGEWSGPLICREQAIQLLTSPTHNHTKETQ
jgi:hypothetical protein